MRGGTAARLLRLRHGIPLRELAEAAGVTHQHISDLETGRHAGRYDTRRGGAALLQRAFEGVIANRAERARRLSEDFVACRHRLLDIVEGKHEL